MSGRAFPKPTWRAKVEDRARALHAANGHPKNYRGPCWGPLPEEIEQAKREIDAEEAKP